LQFQNTVAFLSFIHRKNCFDYWPIFFEQLSGISVPKDKSAQKCGLEPIIKFFFMVYSAFYLT